MHHNTSSFYIYRPSRCNHKDMLVSSLTLWHPTTTIINAPFTKSSSFSFPQSAYIHKLASHPSVFNRFSFLPIHRIPRNILIQSIQNNNLLVQLLMNGLSNFPLPNQRLEHTFQILVLVTQILLWQFPLSNAVKIPRLLLCTLVRVPLEGYSIYEQSRVVGIAVPQKEHEL
ncbi:hypothetical protein L211DRAFT_329420 [Terfezia boudieri ATCC MYA-4762]|uniref:Uncharacterized protein n=1 Tax=Terfezia boudieri ATCC MYA-4762 TaxID=1051890 RepID=A0A3N4LI33_9PEZI|nr:hypothetical protein L211DRAFT_329420 [Terfezia boudieri ATCC MYA-4762]